MPTLFSMGKKIILDSVYHQSKVALTDKVVPKKMAVTAYFQLKVLLLKLSTWMTQNL